MSITPGGALTLSYAGLAPGDESASIVVVTPSGDTVCGQSRVAFNPASESGRYEVWVAVPSAGGSIQGTVLAQHLQGL